MYINFCCEPEEGNGIINCHQKYKQEVLQNLCLSDTPLSFRTKSKKRSKFNLWNLS